MLRLRNKFIFKEWRLLDVTPCGSCKDCLSEELSTSIIGVTRISELVVPSSPILVTQMMDALRSSETSGLTLCISS
jgi:hypothetical protein